MGEARQTCQLAVSDGVSGRRIKGSHWYTHFVIRDNEKEEEARRRAAGNREKKPQQYFSGNSEREKREVNWKRVNQGGVERRGRAGLSFVSIIEEVWEWHTDRRHWSRMVFTIESTEY